MLRVAICDDNNVICSELESYILEYAKANFCEMETEVFWSGESLIEHIKTEYQFDLIFLDIELGSMSGVNVGKVIRQELRDHISKIVFVSGANGYEMDLFNLQPLNFLKKPVNKKNIFMCIDLAYEIISSNNTHFEYKTNHETKRIMYGDILYLESKLKKVKIVTTQDREEFYGSLDKINEILPKYFISPHRSFIINFLNVTLIQKDTLTMINGETVPISQRNLKNIRSLQLELEKEKRDARL